MLHDVDRGACSIVDCKIENELKWPNGIGFEIMPVWVIVPDLQYSDKTSSNDLANTFGYRHPMRTAVQHQAEQQNSSSTLER